MCPLIPSPTNLSNDKGRAPTTKCLKLKTTSHHHKFLLLQMVLFREPTQQMLNEFLSRIELATVHSEEEDSEDRGQEDNIKMFENVKNCQNFTP